MLDFCELAISRISSKQSDFPSAVDVKRKKKNSTVLYYFFGLFFLPKITNIFLFFFCQNWPFSSQHTLHFWLEQGVAGIAICSTDPAYSEQVKRHFSNLYSTRLIFFFKCTENHSILDLAAVERGLPELQRSGG